MVNSNFASLRLNLCPGMGRFIYLLNPLPGNMSVDLGAGHPGMSEQFLNRPQIRSSIQQMSGEGMPESVRCQISVQAQRPQVLHDNSVKAPGAQAFASPVDKQRVAVVRRLCYQGRPCLAQVQAEGLGSQLPIGATRSFRPFPLTINERLSRSRSPMFTWTTSPIRSPEL